MATYKLIQDIEAEDHILGPLTLRQFIFALITTFLLYLDFLCVVKHVPFMLIFLLPPTLLGGFFSFPFGRDQPTEVWALAKLRFWFKPHLRVWNQSGVKELVTITVPKKIQRVYTDGLTQGEVKSRLKALASTIDSRGWAIKNIDVDSYTHNPLAGVESDRLLDIDTMPRPVPDDDVTARDDILDASSNPIAQQFTTMIDRSTAAHRQTLLDRMNLARQGTAASSGSNLSSVTSNPAAPPTTDYRQPAPAEPPADYWFMTGDPTAAPVHPIAPLAAAEPTAEEQALVTQRKQQAESSQSAAYGHLHTLQPLSASNPSSVVSSQAAQQTTDNRARTTALAAADAAILSLANNNDLDVATIARQAHKKKGGGEDEVVIPLR